MSVYLSLIFSSFVFSVIELFKANRKNLYLKVIKKIYIFILFILFIFNRNNNDYQIYLKIFDGGYVKKEKGYLLFINFIKSIGGNHNIVILISGMLLIYVLFFLYTKKNEISFIFLYLLCGFVYDINQIRNLFCIMFILIGIKFLQKRKDCIYLIFNTLASSFQSLGFVYFIFYFLQKIKLKKYFKIVTILFIFGFLLTPIFPKIITFVSPKKAVYYLSLKPRFGMLLYYIFIAMDIFMLKYKNRITKKDILLIKFILFPIIFLPYSFLFLEIIHRIWRNTLYIKWFYLLKDLENEKKKYIIFILLISQQIMFISANFIKSNEAVINLLSQVGNLGFYF